MRLLFIEIKDGHFRWAWSRKRLTGIRTSKTFLWDVIINNWQEYKMYRQNKLPMLMPTYFSLFGLINIQKTGTPIDIDELDFEWQIYKITNNDLYCDIHHLGNPDNFVMLDGKIMIVDYNFRLKDFLEKHGKTIQEKFDPKFKRS